MPNTPGRDYAAHVLAAMERLQARGVYPGVINTMNEAGGIGKAKTSLHRTRLIETGRITVTVPDPRGGKGKRRFRAGRERRAGPEAAERERRITEMEERVAAGRPLGRTGRDA